MPKLFKPKFQFDDRSKIANRNSEIGPGPGPNQELIDLPIVNRKSEIDALLSQLPPHLRDSQQWRALLIIFYNVPRLNELIPRYIDLPRAEVHALTFWNKMFGYLSFTEVFMATLAFHLFNAQYPLPADGLNSMRHLDHHNLEIALAALRTAID